jgi:hypothetical protein
MGDDSGVANGLATIGGLEVGVGVGVGVTVELGSGVRVGPLKLLDRLFAVIGGEGHGYASLFEKQLIRLHRLYLIVHDGNAHIILHAHPPLRANRLKTGSLRMISGPDQIGLAQSMCGLLITT